MSKIWKSDGPESKYLENLFRCKKLNAYSKPATVQNKYPIFAGFSGAVFRKNFALAKTKCCTEGMHFKQIFFFLIKKNHNISAPNYDGMTLEQMITAEEESDPRNFLEFDGIEKPSMKISKTESNQSAITPNFYQQPIVPCVYTDGETKQEKCLVVLMLYPGVKGINVDIITEPNSPEQTLKVTYEWPKAMYDVMLMFKKDADNIQCWLKKLIPKL